MKKIYFKELCDIVLILFFCLVIATPLVTINTTPGKIFEIENKTLAALPHFRNPDGRINLSFIRQMDDYLNDNVGFKQEAVLTNIAGNYKFFKKFNIPNYILGTNQHVFYNNGDKYGIETYQGTNHYSENELQNLASELKSIDKYFKENDMNFIVMSIPDKENVYPEYYPKTIQQFSKASRLDVLIKYINQNTDINAFNMKNILINNKNSGLLYYKNFDPTHWNMNGAFLGYQELMNRIKQNYPSISIFTKNDFNIVKTQSNGSLQSLDYKITNKAMNFHDDIYSYNPVKSYESISNASIPMGVNIDLNYNYVNYHNENNKSAPRILVIGDSYIMPLLPMISESFSDLYFTRIPPASEVKKMIDYADPDIVVLEFVERAYSENIIKQLAVLPLTMEVTFPYINSNQIEADIFYNIDIPKFSNGGIIINNDLETQIISGWAFDPKNEKTVTKLYLKIGEKYFMAQNVKRPDVADYFNNQSYNDSGFTFNIPTEAFKGNSSAELLFVTREDLGEYMSVFVEINTTN